LPNINDSDPPEEASESATSPPQPTPAVAEAVNAAVDLAQAPSDPPPAPPTDPTPPSPNKPKFASMPGTPAFVGGFGGSHPGGVLFVIGDGSVRFISQNISRQILQGLANRSDGKLPNSDF